MTWFQWLQEQGVDEAELSKEEWADWFDQYSAYRREVLARMGEIAEGAASGMIANDYIEVSVGDNGHFTIGTREGNPSFTSDNNRRLLYGHPGSSTSETLIYVDGGDYSNYFSADTITYSGTTATATMMIPSMQLKVIQTLKLVKSGSADFADMVSIQYQVQNTGTTARSVGIRIMMDTMLANNDYAPFMVASVGRITEGRVFTGAGVPNLYQVYDNLDNPTTLAIGYLYRGSDRRPDKVQFCNWRGIVGSGWNHSVSDGSYLGDSAVGIYFDPVSVRAGSSTTVRTYYGVSIDSGTASTADPLKKDEMLILVREKDTGDMVQGAEVTYTYNGTTETKTTDSRGRVTIKLGTTGNDSGTALGNVQLKITKAAYKNYKRPDSRPGRFAAGVPDSQDHRSKAYHPVRCPGDGWGLSGMQRENGIVGNPSGRQPDLHGQPGDNRWQLYLSGNRCGNHPGGGDGIWILRSQIDDNGAYPHIPRPDMPGGWDHICHLGSGPTGHRLPAAP